MLHSIVVGLCHTILDDVYKHIVLHDIVVGGGHEQGQGLGLGRQSSNPAVTSTASGCVPLWRAAEHGLARVARPSCVPPLLCGPGCLPPRSSQPRARCQQSPARQTHTRGLPSLDTQHACVCPHRVASQASRAATHGRPSPRASRVARAKPCVSHPHARAQGSSTGTMAQPCAPSRGATAISSRSAG